MMGFAAGLHLGASGGRGSRVGPALLFVAGTAIALMAFETDPIRRTGPRTLHGWIHDAAFVLFVIAVLAAFFFLWRRFRIPAGEITPGTRSSRACSPRCCSSCRG